MVAIDVAFGGFHRTSRDRVRRSQAHVRPGIQLRGSLCRQV